MFLQKISYYTPCDFQDTETGKECRGGYLWPNKGNVKCSACNGTGKKIHTSSQDVIEVQLPKAGEEQMMVITPDKFVHYVDIPTKILEIQQANIEKIGATNNYFYFWGRCFR